MLLLVDEELGAWSCEGNHDAIQVFDPSRRNNLGRDIRPTDAIWTRQGKMILIHQQEGRSFIIEWCVQSKMLHIIHEEWLTILSIDMDTEGKLMAVLRDSSMMYSTSCLNRTFRKLRPISNSTIVLRNLRVDALGNCFAATKHFDFGECIHYGSAMDRMDSYWSHIHWKSNIWDYALGSIHTITIATNRTTFICRYSWIEANNEDYMDLQILRHIPVKNLFSMCVDANDIIFVCVPYGQQRRLCVWRRIGNNMTWVKRGSNQSIEWNHTKIRTMDSMTKYVTQNERILGEMCRQQTECYCGLRGNSNFQSCLPQHVISKIMY